MGQLAKQDKGASTPSLPPSLHRAVTEATVDYANRVVWVDRALAPADFAGLEKAIATLEAQLVPATDEERMACLGELVVVLPPPRLEGEGAPKVRWRAYHKALEDIPAGVLREACDHVLKTAAFFPKPAEIRAAAMSGWARRIKPLSRLKALRDMPVRVRGDAVSVEEDREQRKRFAAMMREVAARNFAGAGA